MTAESVVVRFIQAIANSGVDANGSVLSATSTSAPFL